MEKATFKSSSFSPAHSHVSLHSVSARQLQRNGVKKCKPIKLIASIHLPDSGERNLPEETPSELFHYTLGHSSMPPPSSSSCSRNRPKLIVRELPGLLRLPSHRVVLFSSMVRMFGCPCSIKNLVPESASTAGRWRRVHTTPDHDGGNRGGRENQSALCSWTAHFPSRPSH